MYFNLVGGEVKFDEEQFATLMESNAISKSVAARQETLQANFGSVFDLTRRAVRFDGGDDAELNVSDDEN
jgi:hypothetical protein